LVEEFLNRDDFDVLSYGDEVDPHAAFRGDQTGYTVWYIYGR
jgi:hypothetical protein